MLAKPLARRKRKVKLQITKSEFENYLSDFNSYAEEVINMPTLIQSTQPLPAAVPQRRDSRGRFAGQPNPPSFKQLYKFAQDFTDRMNQQSVGTLPTFRPITQLPSLEEYANIVRIAERYNLIGARANPESTHATRIAGEAAYQALSRLYSNTSDSMERGEQYYRYTDGLTRARRVSGRVKTADVLSELLAVCKAFPCIWNEEAKGIDIITPPATIISPVVRSLKYEFGQFYIYLRSTSRDNLPWVKALTPRLARGSQHFHPHAQENGRLCYGEGGTASLNNWRAGRIFEIVDIISSILNTYGSNPYVRIEEWNGVCDVRFNPDTGQQVAIDAILPPAQVLHCGGCGSDVEMLVNCENGECSLHNVCIGCVISCQHPGCHNYVCEDHIFRCRNCGHRTCSQHYHMGNNSYCDQCTGWVSDPARVISEEEEVGPEWEADYENDDEDDEDEDDN